MRSVLLAAALAITMLSPSPASASADLFFEISTDARNYGPGETVVVNVTIKNLGTEDFLLAGSASASDVIDVSVADASAKAVDASAPRRAFVFGPEKEVRIKAGSAYTLRGPLSDWGYKLVKPGEYSIHAQPVSPDHLRPYSTGTTAMQEGYSPTPLQITVR